MSSTNFPRGFAFRLVSVESKNSLHGANPLKSDGNVVHYAPHDWDAQKWVFSRVSGDDDVYVISNLGSGQVLHGDNLRSGGNARQYPLWPMRNGTNRDPLIDCQMWRAERVEGDTYTLENLDTGGMLTAGPLSRGEGNVTQVRGDGTTSQRWSVIADGPLWGGDGLPWGTQDDIYIMGVSPEIARLPVGIGVDFDERMVPNSESSSVFRLPTLPKMRSPLRRTSSDAIPGFWEYYRAGTDGVSGPVLDADKRILFRAGVVHDIMYSSRMPDGLHGEPRGSKASTSSSAHKTWKMVADKVMFLNSLALLARAYGKPRFPDALVVANRIYDALFTAGWDAYAGGQGRATKGEGARAPMSVDQLEGMIDFLRRHGVDDRAKKVRVDDWDWEGLTGLDGGHLNRTPPRALTSSDVNGHNLAEAVHSAGALRQVGTHEWREVDAEGAVRFTFVEDRRDAWSVYLDDPGRAVSLQVDAFRKVIRYKSRSSSWSDLYSIRQAQAVAG